MRKSVKLTILLAEDEKAIATVISYNLQKAGFNVHIVHDGLEAEKWIKNSPPDLVLLDWMLPSKSGLDICSDLRADPKTASVPIIMISAKSQDVDKVEGLNCGADDYLAKPFSPMELIARVQAVFRRVRPVFAAQTLEFHDIVMDLNSCVVTRSSKGEEKEVKLAPTEFQILQRMMEHSKIVLSRQFIIEKVWGRNATIDARVVDVHITRLRKALLESSADDFDVVKTVRLRGYRLQLPRVQHDASSRDFY